MRDSGPGAGDGAAADDAPEFLELAVPVEKRARWQVICSKSDAQNKKGARCAGGFYRPPIDTRFLFSYFINIDRCV